jgi:hypothetical protein
MSATHIDLFKLDVLPGRSSIQAEVRIEGETLHARFQARKLARDLHREQRSEWSGWFLYEDEPIALCWDSFTWAQ